jgi:probable F420-dependent oxidoreductase
MEDHRPFRFGVLAFGEPTRRAWVDRVRQIEGLGYDVLSLGEHHFSPLAPLSAMAAAAMVTERVRIGSLVLANDFRNPVLLAREAATIDVLSEGRLELGLGSGFMAEDYRQTGIPLDPPGVRVDRLAEAVGLIKRAFCEETLDHRGTHLTVEGLGLLPKPVQQPHPPLVIGGGSRRVLGLAAREADIVSINIRTARDGSLEWASLSPGATAEKVAWVREAAVSRSMPPEVHWLVLHVAVTDRAREEAQRFIEAWGATGQIGVDDALASPHVLIGSEDAIIEKIQRSREDYGASYFSVFVRAIEVFAPIVARLSGS